MNYNKSGRNSPDTVKVGNPNAPAMNIPTWAWYVFGISFLLIIVLLVLDYFLIRRNALGTSCLSFVARRKGYRTGNASTGGKGNYPTDPVICGPSGGGGSSQLFHQKRSTNMILSTGPHVRV